MASIAINRASWSLRVSRSSRTFTVSFSTHTPRRHRSARRLAPTDFHTPRVASHARSFTSASRSYEESSSTASATNPTPIDSSTFQRTGLSDSIPPLPTPPPISTSKTPTTPDGVPVDWSRSFHGLSAEAFPKEAADVLLAPIAPEDVEIKPDGIIYLPEIKYRRILNRAFGPGGWGLAPRGETIVTQKAVTREWALVVLGRLVSVARGEQDYFSPDGIPTAAEGCRSNALLRCCKDLGIASELWDPRFVRTFMKEKAKEMWVEHALTKKKRKIWLRKEDQPAYPYKESKMGSASGSF